MTTADLLRLRLQKQYLEPTRQRNIREVVSHFGAMQSQDYHGGKWAIAQRTSGITSTQIDDTFAKGTILRTHVMRPTWHFVAAEDVNWMLALTGPRVNTLSAHYYRQLELDDAAFAKANTVLIQTLQGKAYKTRTELGKALTDAGFDVHVPVRLIYILVHAELDGLICSGPLREKTAYLRASQ